MVDALAADWLVRDHLRNVIARLKYVGVPEHQQRPRFGGFYIEIRDDFENGDASALGSDQRARDMEVVFGQKFVEVITRKHAVGYSG